MALEVNGVNITKIEYVSAGKTSEILELQYNGVAYLKKLAPLQEPTIEWSSSSAILTFRNPNSVAVKLIGEITFTSPYYAGKNTSFSLDIANLRTATYTYTLPQYSYDYDELTVTAHFQASGYIDSTETSYGYTNPAFETTTQARDDVESAGSEGDWELYEATDKQSEKGEQEG